MPLPGSRARHQGEPGASRLSWTPLPGYPLHGVRKRLPSSWAERGFTVDLTCAPSSRRGGVCEACLVGEDDCLDAVSEVELLEDVGDVRLDGGFADEELFADLCVRQAAGDQTKYLEFALGEVVELRRSFAAGGAGELVDHVFGARALVPTRIACYRRPLTNMGRPEPDPAEVPFGSNRTEDTMYKLRPIALTGRRWCSRADEAAGVANRR